MTIVNLFRFGLVEVLWWVSAYGFIDSIVQWFIKNSFSRALSVYGLLLFCVIVFIYYNPEYMRQFIFIPDGKHVQE